MLFGFKNGGKSDYTLSSGAGDELRIAVAGTTTVARRNFTHGQDASGGGAASFEDTTVPFWNSAPHSSSANHAWNHGILYRTDDEHRCPRLDNGPHWLARYRFRGHAIALGSNVNVQKTPSAGALLRLRAPVAQSWGTSSPPRALTSPVLPRGYVA